MTRVRTTGVLAFFTVVLLAGQTALATFHLWYIKEIYSNYDGTVQFVELFTDSNSQQFLPGHNIQSNSTVYNFPGNSPAPTGGHHLLLGTPGYAALAAAPASGLPAPNYTFAANNFFSVAGDTVNFAGVDIKSFAPIPSDGVMSLNYTGFGGTATSAENTPRNYVGTTIVPLNLPPSTGDYNGDGTVNAADYTVWRNSVGMEVGAGTGADGSHNSLVDAADYVYWRVFYGGEVPGEASIDDSFANVPEPTSFMLMLIVLGLLPIRSFRRSRCWIG
jgi:hypothetical protein